MCYDLKSNSFRVTLVIALLYFMNHVYIASLEQQLAFNFTLIQRRVLQKKVRRYAARVSEFLVFNAAVMWRRNSRFNRRTRAESKSTLYYVHDCHLMQESCLDENDNFAARRR